MKKENKKDIYGRIYMITNLINKKRYVGLTTKTLEERFQAHLNKAIVERSAIQKAMKKYGKENFTIEQLDIASSKGELFEKELNWIAKLDTFNGYGYNLTAGGGGITDMSIEIRQKISKTKTGKSILKLKGRVRSKEERIKISRGLGAKKVKGTHKISKNEIFYDYPTQAKKDGFNPSLICAVIKGKRPHHKNYVFEYVNDANPDLPIDNKKSMAVQRIETETDDQNIMSPRDRDPSIRG
jgi:group I intron endonuclease